MGLAESRHRQIEQMRINDLMQLVPESGNSVLDVGARDGYLSIRLAEFFDSVTALDLTEPSIDHQKIRCVAGDVTCFDFADNTFDVVFCAEVLEHIPAPGLQKACAELIRVARQSVIIGVPYQQDIRIGRTTCISCGRKNPPWGHANRFDTNRLQQLFSGMTVTKTSFVGVNDDATNALSCWLMDLAGNPYGTYEQDEPCLYCYAKLHMPPTRNLPQKILTKLACYINNLQKPLIKPHANWIHLLFVKES